jgi:hypothetical protein
MSSGRESWRGKVHRLGGGEEDLLGNSIFATLMECTVVAVMLPLPPARCS